MAGRDLGPPPPKDRVVEVGRTASRSGTVALPSSSTKPARADNALATVAGWIAIAAFMLAYVTWAIFYVVVLMPSVDAWSTRQLGFSLGKLHAVPIVGLPILALLPFAGAWSLWDKLRTPRP
jgi:hypothetical protein